MISSEWRHPSTSEMPDEKEKNCTKGLNKLWYSDAKYGQFWQHYNTMIMTAHHDAIVKARYVAAHTKAALSNLSSMYLHANNSQDRHSENFSVKKHCSSSCSTRNSAEIARANRNRQKRKRKMRNRRLRELASNNNQGGLSDTELLHSQMSQGMHIEDADEEGMEVTDDFLKFLEQSEKHREQWKVKKKKLKCISGSISPSEEPLGDGGSREHPDTIRSREMQQLYGQASARIHAMETALQLSFDRFSTLHQPQYWPNIPINVIFS
nr:gem-associated protein 8-like isoform X2 [Cherax quadricarinatus]